MNAWKNQRRAHSLKLKHENLIADQDVNSEYIENSQTQQEENNCLITSWRECANGPKLSNQLTNVRSQYISHLGNAHVLLFVLLSWPFWMG